MSLYTAHHRSFVPGPHRVAVWEPLARGGERSTFNAALLQTAVLAFPNARVAFVAAETHCEAVRGRLGAGVPAGVASLDWAALDVTAPAAAGLRRPYTAWRRARTWFARARALAEDFGAELVLLASVSGPGLLAWNGLRTDRDPPALVVVRGAGEGPLLRALLRWAVRVPTFDVGESPAGEPALTPEVLAPELQRLAQAASRSATTAAASNARGA